MGSPSQGLDRLVGWLENLLSGLIPFDHHLDGDDVRDPHVPGTSDEAHHLLQAGQTDGSKRPFYCRRPVTRPPESLGEPKCLTPAVV